MSTYPSGLPRFGPSALLTPANVVTGARVAFTLPLLAVISSEGPSWRAAVGWIILGTTDGLDGWLARRGGTTRSGAFLDPLADKFLVLGGLAALADIGVFPWLPVALIAFREMTVSVYRAAAGRRGISLPARPLGKSKTVLQVTCVGLALCPLTAEPAAFGLSALWTAVALTLASGLDLVRHGRRQVNPEPT